MHDVSVWLPLVLSAAGATVSFFTFLCVSIIAYLVRYVLASTDRRIVDLERKSDEHATHIASATTQTESERAALAELRTEIGEMRDRFESLATQIATLLGTMTKRPASRR